MSVYICPTDTNLGYIGNISLWQWIVLDAFAYNVAPAPSLFSACFWFIYFAYIYQIYLPASHIPIYLLFIHLATILAPLSFQFDWKTNVHNSNRPESHSVAVSGPSILMENNLLALQLARGQKRVKKSNIVGVFFLVLSVQNCAR